MVSSLIFCLRIELDQTQPLVWRRLALPASANFWTLHVAIQDVFGWQDRHVHEFRLGKGPACVTIGMPHAFQAGTIAPGWLEPLAPHIEQTEHLDYIYDLGDDWHHTVYLEGVVEGDGGHYPRCLAGENATPPEDCGGVYAFAELKAVLAEPHSAGYRDVQAWLTTNHAWPYRPYAFDPARVHFTDPQLRLKRFLRGLGSFKG